MENTNDFQNGKMIGEYLRILEMMNSSRYTIRVHTSLLDQDDLMLWYFRMNLLAYEDETDENSGDRESVREVDTENDEETGLVAVVKLSQGLVVPSAWQTFGSAYESQDDLCDAVSGDTLTLFTSLLSFEMNPETQEEDFLIKKEVADNLGLTVRLTTPYTFLLINDIKTDDEGCLHDFLDIFENVAIDSVPTGRKNQIITAVLLSAKDEKWKVDVFKCHGWDIIPIIESDETVITCFCAYKMIHKSI